MDAFSFTQQKTTYIFIFLTAATAHYLLLPIITYYDLNLFLTDIIYYQVTDIIYYFD